jgi:hypothetical protein
VVSLLKTATLKPDAQRLGGGRYGSKYNKESEVSMYWRIIGYVGAALLILALTVGVGVKMTQKAEGYKANNDQNFYSFEPHFFIGGCARYDAFRKSDAKAEKVEVKKVEKKK